MELPHSIHNHRRELCKSCKTPCEFQNNLEWRAKSASVCPVGRWHAYVLYVKNKAPQKLRGIGDVVEKVAGPIAAAIDKISGGKTKLKGCSACAKRREMLNQYLPFGTIIE